MRTLIPLLLTALATPAAAQTGIAGPPSADVGPFKTSVGRELDSIRRSVDRGRRDGQLSRRDARAARREGGQIGTLANRYAADGYLSDSERAELSARAELLRAEVNRERLLRPASRPD
ncbi:hypothetical protein GGR88_000256 [Sphingomonas jejuensis]|uniref:DUF4148 domain-containing protein n=1 Tax=Sphingomonas jejuensis TaxID=904715 RepID=A0ABX0XIU4_9SPHN|nr:hypothetical protein [Sphingomonas jejuensis]NJC32782.1 hypothetical protein [Sphingomonas jejuensis]